VLADVQDRFRQLSAHIMEPLGRCVGPTAKLQRDAKLARIVSCSYRAAKLGEVRHDAASPFAHRLGKFHASVRPSIKIALSKNECALATRSEKYPFGLPG